ncbi:DUF2399 domain-containing protein [Psychrobacillus soli]|nr:DUF2399 domain-containing protein [Psychrobacillus soli]
MYTVKEFIEKFICKAGESTEQLIENEWQIQKWTARTYKTTGNVLAAEMYDVSPKEEIVKLKLKPNTRRESLPIPEILLEEALYKGWIIQEIRFMKDGRTPLSTTYRMGPGLFEYERLKSEEAFEEDRILKQTLMDEVEDSKGVLANDFFQQIVQFSTDETDSEDWGKERIRKFHYFLIAFLQLKRLQPKMEYKEIGATYYKKTGGSKAFDSYREAFIRRLEKWLNAPISELGIISVGSIVPIFFTGNLTGTFSSYSLGTVHATTEIAVTDENFQTSAKTLWLVENRAVLTRMATEVEFLQNTEALVIGVDGHIRGAHLKMIKQLCSNSSIEKAIIWVDYDEAGQIIARDLVNLVKEIPYRLIGNEGNVFRDYELYKTWSSSIQHAEQEMTLGGPEEWSMWIKM